MKKIKFYKINNKILLSSKFKPIFIFDKSLFIISEYIDYTFYIYNGKSFIEVIISNDMVGHKFGEFVSTRKLHKYVKKKKKKK